MTLKDNTIHYYIFPPPIESPDLLTHLTQLCSHLIIHSQFIHKDYIWHQESFNLTPRVTGKNYNFTDNETTKHQFNIPHLYGKTNYGESIDDEWFIVYILREISLKFNDFVIKMFDSDGEFLLIEAAEEIPPWISPENAFNRVFISGRGLHILGGKDELCLEDALKAVRQDEATLASDSVQKSISKRVNQYPLKASKNQHRCNCFVPAMLVRLLKKCPPLLSVFIRSFLTRDKLDLQKAAAVVSRHFMPETRVTHNIRFSRCLYAQLTHENFFPPTRSNWIDSTIPLDQQRRYDLGLKLTFGAAIYLTTNFAGKSSDNPAKKQSFFDFLHKIGYFQNEIEGSLLYCRLHEAAEEFYRQNSAKSAVMSPRECLDFMGTTSTEVSGEEGEDDDEGWLSVDAEEFEEILRSSAGKTVVSNAMQHFVETKSEFDGVVPSNDLLGLDVESLRESVRRLLGEDCEGEFEEMFAEMDDELGDSTLRESFKMGDDGDVDVEGNMLSGFLESYVSQNGDCGPVETLMKQLGLDSTFHSQ